MAQDLEPLATAYGRIFGDRLRQEGESVAIDGGPRITFCRPPAFAQRFAPLGLEVGATGPRLAALRLRTGSLAQTRALLSARRVRHAATARGTILVPAEEACGTLLEFAPS